MGLREQIVLDYDAKLAQVFALALIEFQRLVHSATMQASAFRFRYGSGRCCTSERTVDRIRLQVNDNAGEEVRPIADVVAEAFQFIFDQTQTALFDGVAEHGIRDRVGYITKNVNAPCLFASFRRCCQITISKAKPHRRRKQRAITISLLCRRSWPFAMRD